jgi:hypothetical protein
MAPKTPVNKGAKVYHKSPLLRIKSCLAYGICRSA